MLELINILLCYIFLTSMSRSYPHQSKITPVPGYFQETPWHQIGGSEIRTHEAREGLTVFPLIAFSAKGQILFL